jgi:FkbM family methyltransferase
LYLRRWFPLTRIHAFEPIAETFNLLVQNVSSYPTIRCHQFALGAAKEIKHIHLMRNSELNTLVNEPSLVPEYTDRSQAVKVITLDEFCNNEGITAIDILKLDTQGYESKVLSGAADIIRRVNFVFVEVGLQDQRLDISPFSTIHEHLRSRGFCFCGLYEAYRHWDTKLLISFGNALLKGGAIIDHEASRERPFVAVGK